MFFRFQYLFCLHFIFVPFTSQLRYNQYGKFGICGSSEVRLDNGGTLAHDSICMKMGMHKNHAKASKYNIVTSG